MALCDRLAGDCQRIFLNRDHFATEHSWNGNAILCVIDNDMDMWRKSNDAIDQHWNNATTSFIVYVDKEQFPELPQSQQSVRFDGQSMTILHVHDEMGMLAIALATNRARTVTR